MSHFRHRRHRSHRKFLLLDTIYSRFTVKSKSGIKSESEIKSVCISLIRPGKRWIGVMQYEFCDMGIILCEATQLAKKLGIYFFP